MYGIESGTGGISRKREKVREKRRMKPSGTSTRRRAFFARSGERRGSHEATRASGRQPAALDNRKTPRPVEATKNRRASGRQPAAMDNRNTPSPIEPTKTGTTSAEYDRMHSASSTNLNGSPSALKRCDSFATRISTRTARKENDTSSEELLKKKIVYR